MKNIYTLIITGFLLVFLVGCQEDRDQAPSTSITPELAQQSEKDAFLEKINGLLSSSDVQDQIAEPLGDVHFENLSYFKSSFDENVTFIPVYTEASEHTEAIIVATEVSDRIKIGILVRGHLRRLTPSPNAENTPSLTMLAQLFVVLDDRIFDNANNNFSDIIGAANDNSLGMSRSFEDGQVESNLPLGFEPVSGDIMCTYTTNPNDPDGEDYEQCWAQYHWEWVPSDQVIVDWGPGTGGGPSPFIQVINLKSPCKGNPIKDPEIAPQAEDRSGIAGGRFGNARKNEDGSDKPHNGLDIKTKFGDSVYSMYAGSIYGNGTSKTLGHYSIIQSNINGKTVLILYAHLKYKPVTSGTIRAGEILGISGDSGNLARAILEESTIQHIHIETREGTNWKTATRKNTEAYATTKFDSHGKVIQSTKC